jgi:ribosomal protein S6
MTDPKIQIKALQEVQHELQHHFNGDNILRHTNMNHKNAVSETEQKDG